MCDSIAIMSPLTAKVEGPHNGRESELESEAVAKVTSREDGLRWIQGLIHGNTGRRAAEASGLALRQKIVALSRAGYASCNDTH